jgi:hypothetical protein
VQQFQSQYSTDTVRTLAYAMLPSLLRYAVADVRSSVARRAASAKE